MPRRLRLLLLAGAVLLAGTGAGVWMAADTAGRAERRVRDFVARDQPGSQKYLADCMASARRIGDSAWMVSLGLRGLPMKGDRFLVDREGTVHRVSPAALSKVMREEFAPHDSDPEFIATFLLTLHDEQCIRLDSAAGIPGFEKNPLPREQAERILPEVRTAEGSRVFFTYQQIGGWVRRHEFRYRADGAFVEATEVALGHGIGDALFYQ